MREIEPKTEFWKYSEQEVLAALVDPNENPIATEVARLIDGYAANFAEHCARIGRVPATTIRIQPRCMIEKVAFGLFDASLRQVSLNETPGP